MKHDPLASGKRKPVSLSLDTGIVAAARAAGLNLSQISEAALREAASVERDRAWCDENRAAIEGWNRWIEKNGLPLEDYRVW